MKPLVLLGVIIIALLTGCTYNGKLHSGFYSPASTGSKTPLQVDLVCGDFLKSIVLDPGHIYGAYVVHLKTDPALQEALVKSCESLFDKVRVTSAPDTNADIVILPALELKEHTITLTLTAKSAVTGDVIQQYSASTNFECRAPAGVHAADTIDIFACGGLAPIIVPANTSMIGHSAEDALGKCLAFCLGQIAENVRNDTSLASKSSK